MNQGGLIMNKKAFYALSYGVYITGTMDGNRPTGCTANSAMQITSNPATIAVSINHDNYTHDCIKKSGLFSINIMGVHSKTSLIGRFGFMSGRDTDKFDGVSYAMKAGAPVLGEAISYMVCKVVDTMETSTHTVFLGEVIDADVQKEDTSMTYAYYHSELKGKTAKNAPTYIEEKPEETKVSKWVCSVCGYIYDGDTPFSDLPETYVCPLCKAPKSAFRKE